MSHSRNASNYYLPFFFSLQPCKEDNLSCCSYDVENKQEIIFVGPLNATWTSHASSCMVYLFTQANDRSFSKSVGMSTSLG